MLYLVLYILFFNLFTSISIKCSAKKEDRTLNSLTFLEIIKHASDSALEGEMSEREHLLMKLSDDEVRQLKEFLVSSKDDAREYSCHRYTGPTLEGRKFYFYLPETDVNGVRTMTHRVEIPLSSITVNNSTTELFDTKTKEVIGLRLRLTNEGINTLDIPLKEPVGIPTVTELFLDSNHLLNVPSYCFNNLSHLTFLSLHYNGITILEPNAFAGMPNLKHLDLSHNKLSNLDPRSFAGLIALKELNLTVNILTCFPQELLDEIPSLKTLLLKQNPIIDDTGLKKLMAIRQHLIIDRLQKPKAPQKCIIS